MIQIPAYLCQQTRLTRAVAKTGKPVNVKKGQFMAPEDMAATVGKIRRAGNEDILLTERGSSFGYRTLVVDMRSIPKMQQLGVPVVMDATHAVRIYGVRSDDPSGGEPQFIEMLALHGGCIENVIAEGKLALIAMGQDMDRIDILTAIQRFGDLFHAVPVICKQHNLGIGGDAGQQRIDIAYT